MKVSQSELFGVVAILLYIVFFSHSPPAIISSAVGNLYMSVGLLALLTYVTLYKSRTIGVLLIIALLLTMTYGVEHLSDLSVYSVAPTSQLVKGRCPNPGTALAVGGKFCRGPCPDGTILSGDNCMKVSVSVSSMPTSYPNPPVSRSDDKLQNIASSFTSNPESSAHLVAAVKADPVAFAPIIAKSETPSTPTTSSTIPPLSNPTAPASSSEVSKNSLPEPAETCNIETFAPF